MGNRAAVVFGEGKPSQDDIGMCLKWNGGPESVYAFVKLLASYKLSQDGDLAGTSTESIDPPSMATRFVQLATNYFSNDASSFSSIYITSNPGAPGSERMPTENGIYTVRPDLSVERHDFKGRKWTNKERLDEFEAVLSHTYWEDPSPAGFIQSLRHANDRAFLRMPNSEGDVEFHAFKVAALPIEVELQKALAATRAKSAARARGVDRAPSP